MIDTKELRRKLRSDDPIDHIDIHANVKPVLTELLDRLEAVEKERDSYKFAFSEYSEKTEWVQQGINDGTVSAKYLGWHRADVMSDLLRAVEKERDALRAKIETAENDTAHELRALAASALRVVKGWERKCGELRAKIEALERMEKQEPSREWWDSLIADISAIDCVYRGWPTYAHDAYWMRDRVVWTLKQRRDSTPGVKGE